jgi:hypothetical protein
MDFVFVASTLVFAAVTFGFVALCVRVEKRP